MKSNTAEMQALMAASKQQFLDENMRPGEVYAGILLGVDGARDAHIFVMPESTSGTWDHCMKWAKALGGFLPTRREQRLLFANAKAAFEPKWHWSSEQHADVSATAWSQDFNDGFQLYTLKSNVGLGRPIRRLEI